MSYPTLPSKAFSASQDISRQRLVAAIIAHSPGMPGPFSGPREQHYLEQFKRGRLTIDEVVYYLEALAPGLGVPRPN